MKAIYIAWIGYQRRAEAMKSFFGYELFYVSSKHAPRVVKFISYVSQAWTMIGLLMKERPDVVWLQLPPTFLIHLVVFYRLFVRRPVKIVADCHNAAFRFPWVRVPLTSFFLRRVDLVLVHNDAMLPMAHRLNVDGDRLKVLGDSVPSFASLPPCESKSEKPMIVMPCSFHADEPIGAVLEAAHLFQAATFIITGNSRKIASHGLIKKAPSNVIFSGFLPTHEFDRLLLRATAVLCLTTEEGIQLSAASEAIAAGKPMIISNTKLLRNLFGEVGLFVDNSVGSILRACQEAVGDYERHSTAVRDMRVKRMKEWLTEAEPVRLRLARNDAISGVA